MVTSESSGVDASELRRRLPQQPATAQHANSTEAAQEAVSDLNADEKASDKPEEDKRAFGRTPDGTVFTVPYTHDMVSQLLSPYQPKNGSDLFVLGVLVAHVLTLILLPPRLRVPTFAVIFLFWRSCYNGGIGFLLKEQSDNKSLVAWARKSKIFINPETGDNPHPAIYNWLKREMETKVPKDYKFDEAPLEYNTWLAFRRVVDLILMCDFVSYCLFAIACSGRPEAEHVAVTAGRWLGGITLVLFNLWVKLDAHRVVKDYAWYWGDFFFLIDQELTFDGVFEMAPHPMYSVGYAGYYGISLMAASYKVLLISIIAHAAQFAFLYFFEMPHIDKIYNQPPPRKQKPTSLASETENVVDVHKIDNSTAASLSTYNVISQLAAPRALLGIKNFDAHRISDVSVALIQAYFCLLAFYAPSTPLYQVLFVAHAAIWRLWYSVGIGYILDRQSKKKKWVRHFIKYGESTKEAWRQWKAIYHFSMTLCWTSFVVAAFKMYHLPQDWTYGMATFRHVFGGALILLQLWTTVSIYEAVGEFGFFFGDFFTDRPPRLTYSGIYRYLNNPERILGLAGVWGFALITWSRAIFFLAMLSHVLSLCFQNFVERPHMERLYGGKIRQSSGVTISLKRSLPAKVREWSNNVDRIFDGGLDVLEDFIDTIQPKFIAGVETIVKDYKNLFEKYPARISITKLAPDLAGYDPNTYSLIVEGTPASNIDFMDRASGREGNDAERWSYQGDDIPTVFEYGAPIKVRWTAPAHHSKLDWIGLYMVSDNSSRLITRISSQGRWVATCKDEWDSERAEIGIITTDVPQHDADTPETSSVSGEVEFSGDKLWWTTGVFEFRLHHDGKHNVMAVSNPFEVRIGRFDEEDVELDNKSSIRTAIETALLPVIRNCFDRDPEIAPSTVEDAYGALVERDGKFAKRVVYAVRAMFGIEFAPEVVKADGNVRNLAWRICNAKQVLAPYSMSRSSKGTTTPAEAKD